MPLENIKNSHDLNSTKLHSLNTWEEFTDSSNIVEGLEYLQVYHSLHSLHYAILTCNLDIAYILKAKANAEANAEADAEPEAVAGAEAGTEAEADAGARAES